MGLYQNRIVIKVGTSTLKNEMGKSDLRSFDRLVCTLSDIQNMGYEVILVSSGAIAVGANKLNMKERPASMRMKQAAAAVGQCSIMYQLSQCGHEPESITVYHGTFQHHHDAELLRTRNIRFRKG